MRISDWSSDVCSSDLSPVYGRRCPEAPGTRDAILAWIGPVTAPSSSRPIALAHALTLLYALAGVAAMWWLSPRVPYADAWRFLGHFLQAPFPYDILAPDNGHHELLPNAVRVLELHAFAAQPGLQVVVGIVLALATGLVFARGIRGLADSRAKAAALLGLEIGSALCRERVCQYV